MYAVFGLHYEWNPHRFRNIFFWPRLTTLLWLNFFLINAFSSKFMENFRYVTTLILLSTPFSCFSVFTMIWRFLVQLLQIYEFMNMVFGFLPSSFLFYVLLIFAFRKYFRFSNDLTIVMDIANRIISRFSFKTCLKDEKNQPRI